MSEPGKGARDYLKHLPGVMDRSLQIAEFVSTVWVAVDGGLRRLSRDYKDMRPHPTLQPIRHTTQPHTPAPTPHLYRTTPYRSFNPDDYSDEDLLLFRGVKGRDPYSSNEMDRWLDNNT